VKNGIDIIKTPFQHTQMSDRGPESVKEKIQEALDKFLGATSDLSPNDTDNPLIGKPPAPTATPEATAPESASPNPSASNAQAPAEPVAPKPIVSNPPTPAPGATKSGS
jgi:hypothetical protein